MAKVRCKCGKGGGINCTFKSCKACCIARPLSEPPCRERYHKRDSASPSTDTTSVSSSASSASTSTPTTSSSPESSAPTQASSSSDPVPPPQPYAQPLHDIWAPATAEVAIADRLKHKSRREAVAESQTRLVLGALRGGVSDPGVEDREGPKTVKFLIWKAVRSTFLRALNVCN